MKKVFGVLLLTVGISMFAVAQNTTFGLKAGLNVAKVSAPDGPDYETRAGLHVGGLAHIHINRNWAVQPELVYSMQGAKREVSGDDVEYKLNYLNVPVLAQYMFKDGFRVQTGPQVGFLTSAKTEVGDVEVKAKDNYSDVDVSWVFGAGYLFPQGIGIDARYNLGLNNIAENGGKAFNRVFQVGLFYQFMNHK